MALIHESKVSAANLRIAIICARFNETVTRALLDGALSALRSHGADESTLEVAWVPGSFELPVAAQRAALRPDVAAVVCLGAVIRGETPHFEYVCMAAANGIQQVALESGKPVAFGVLTTNTVEQAFDRAGGRIGNKGVDAALAALEMIHVLNSLGGPASSL